MLGLFNKSTGDFPQRTRRLWLVPILDSWTRLASGPA